MWIHSTMQQTFVCSYVKITVVGISRCMRWTCHHEMWFEWTFPKGSIISRYLGSGAPLQFSAFHLSQLALEWKGLVVVKSNATEQTPVHGLWRYKYFFYLEEKIFNSGFNSSTLIYLHTHTILIYTNILVLLRAHTCPHTHTHKLRQPSRNLSLPLFGITAVLIFPYPALMLILVPSCCVYLTMLSIGLSFDAFAKGQEYSMQFLFIGMAH